METKYLFVNTIGCQMNVYDSRRIISGLRSIGYQESSSAEQADLVIVNTCTVREKAEQKAFSFLGRLAALKKKKPDLIIGVGGCLAQQEGKAILKRVPSVDIIFGTHAIGRLPEQIMEIEKTRCRIVDAALTDTIEPVQPSEIFEESAPVSGFVTIMRGCDNFCTYCIVPYVRGREISRPPDEILNEIKTYVSSGMREVTLLGQNVNSYGTKEGLCSFSELLSMTNEINGLSRIRFTTSHPKDISEELIRSFKDLDKLCNHIHLPVQSGSDRILKKMNRKYTRDHYLAIIEKLRRSCPDIAITSDMIVGFPGETAADFEDTLDLVKAVRFDGLFAFVYSDRPNAPAVRFPDKVSEPEKKERLQRLLNLQERYTKEKNEALVGTVEPVLVEGPGKKQVETNSEENGTDSRWTGRTSTNKIVNFSLDEKDIAGAETVPGKTINIKIIRALAHSLWGKPVGHKESSHDLKGDKSYAA
ncbi:MAG: tRNA (N6-isopentenyl adenosine(37)-C2)-methylthiotransferase MiaB [Desulfobacterales bacterium]